MGCVPSRPVTRRRVQRRRAPAPDPVCPVCLDPLWRGGGGDVVRIACGHIFHGACLEGWWATSLTCPSCRRQTQKTELRPFSTRDDLKRCVAEVILRDLADTSQNPAVERDLFRLLATAPPKI